MNGEDHYANPGERTYFAANEGRLGDVVFAMHGVPALAVTSERIQDLVATVVHTPADTVEWVDPAKLVRLARSPERLLARLGAKA
ncbi:MAG: hypothetical protein K0A98_07230 [Trueperaceae bacterium]|nr:hypothetical protein [Trueperaceae bacterium]